DPGTRRELSMPSGKHATGHTRKSGQLRYRTDAGKPSGLDAGRAVTIWSGWPDSNRRPPRPKRGALAKLRYSPYLAECSGWPGMFAVRTGCGQAWDVPEGAAGRETVSAAAEFRLA